MPFFEQVTPIPVRERGGKVKDAHDLEVCVVDKKTGMLFVWGGGQTVNIYDANEYVRCMLNGFADEPNTFGMYMMEFGGVGAEDFIASVHEHLMEEDGDEPTEESN